MLSWQMFHHPQKLPISHRLQIPSASCQLSSTDLNFFLALVPLLYDERILNSITSTNKCPSANFEQALNSSIVFCIILKNICFFYEKELTSHKGVINIRTTETQAANRSKR